MGKENRVIADREEMEAIIRGCKVCRLGMADGSEPYVVPMSFGYDGNHVYLHTSPRGRKMEILRRHPRVCLEFDILDGMIESDRGCGWSVRFRSVLIFGNALELADPEEKRRGLATIMAQYSSGEYTFPDEILERTAVIRIDIESMTGRKRK